MARMLYALAAAMAGVRRRGLMTRIKSSAGMNLVHNQGKGTNTV